MSFISKKMTLPALVGIADKHAKKEISLSNRERRYLASLLEAYGEEILTVGQVVNFGSVVLVKTIGGDIQVEFSE